MSLQRSHACGGGSGVCVAAKHGLVVMSTDSKRSGCCQLRMYSLGDGSLVRSIGSLGSGNGQFNYGLGRLCVSPDGDSVLVAEEFNQRVQQVRIVDGSWVRFFGEGVLSRPEYVDCNAEVVVVSDNWHGITVLSWADNSLRGHIGSYHDGLLGCLDTPLGVRLLGDGSGVVVADAFSDRLCVFTLGCDFVAEVGSFEQGLDGPHDVLECVLDGGFNVVNYMNAHVVKLSGSGIQVGVFNNGGELAWPTAVAALPDGGMVMLDCDGTRCSIIRDRCHRLHWIGLCVFAGTVSV
jgi:hypothetical protein